MRLTRIILVLLTCVAFGHVIASAAELKEMSLNARSRKEGFATVKMNGSLVSIIHAIPKELIELLYPATPIVGLEHLPKDRFFESNDLEDDEALLRQLGEKLGLTITRSEVTTEFLLIRNLSQTMPFGWSPAHSGEGSEGIEEVDKADHLVVAPSIDMQGFIRFLSEYTKQPILNQTSLGGKYRFSFILKENDDVGRLLVGMGFDVVRAKRTRECVVVAPKRPSPGKD